MDFSKINPDKIIHKDNQDYNLELWWYGFKNLVANLFRTNKNLIDYTKLFSNKLNEYQEKKKYQEIYYDIHDYILIILKLFYTTAKNTQLHEANLIITWIKRYNYIEYVPKIKLPDNYTGIKIEELNDKESIILKFYIKYFEIEYKINKDLIKLFKSNLYEFLDYCIINKYERLINILSMKYNLGVYYKYKNRDINYLPIKARKLIYLINKSN